MPPQVNLPVSTELRTESRPVLRTLRGPDTAASPPPKNKGISSAFAGKRVHFIGIGGSGMSGLARVLLDAGAIVTGSEAKPNPQTFELTRAGAAITREQIGEGLSKEIDLVVRTAAIKDDNREYLAAKAFGLNVIKYAQLLGAVMKERVGVAVAGTHGKSTTSAMISYALLRCDADPSFVIGGTVPQLGGTGSRSGKGKTFVAEACEFDRSFHNLHPSIAIITNVEEDHLDCYKNIDEIVESFRTFAAKVPPGGLIIAGGNDPRVTESLIGAKAQVELAALAPGFAWSTETTSIENGCYYGTVSHNGQPVAKIRMSIPGEHNLINATMAVAACKACGVDPQRAADAIGDFTGVDRRMSLVGAVNGATVVDDYGHHPTEIRATLKALREKYQPARLFCVFQPHQHSRTRFLLDDFASSFANADQTIVPDIFFVRDTEAERHLVSASDLVDRVRGAGHSAQHIPIFADIVDHLRNEARTGDLIVTMGAGNVWEIGRELVN